MKIYQLLEILKGRSQNDEIVVPCGPGQVTDVLTVIPLRIGPNVDNIRHVALLPAEGDWRRGPGTPWEKVEVTEGIPARDTKGRPGEFDPDYLPPWNPLSR